MYLDDITLNFIQPCTTDSLRIRIKAILSRDISKVFPYLNTHLKNGIYNKNANTFTFNKEHKIITIYSDNVAIAKLLNETDAFETLDYLKDIINEVDSKRDEIEPSYEMIKLPSPLELYTYLPKLNCKKCGHPTCLAFATKVLNGQEKVKKCLHLYEKHNKENYEEVENMILLLGYEI
ncbi:(Fe-S)-binding protein [Romboutsia sp.]|uniref:(Fe-S)-binding protein n=1 Tax=Romboutsia sp. TaxID=1965302 RepID=UPI003F2C29FA